MQLEWVDPTPKNTCPQCEYFAGFVFTSGMELPLPAHPDCECYYSPTNKQPTKWSWATIPPEAKNPWVGYVAWLLRTKQAVPAVLRPLIPDAIKRNASRGLQEQNMEQLNVTLNHYDAPVRVDREEHIIYGVSVIQGNVEALGHKMLVDDTAVSQIVTLGSQPTNGIKSRFTHPGLSNNGMGKFLGRLKNFREEGSKALADLHLSPSAAKSPSGDLRDYVETLAEDDPEAFGLSVHAKGIKVWKTADGQEVAAKDGRPDNATTKKPFIRFTSLHAVDTVDEPAANRDGLFSSKTTSPLAAAIFDGLDEFCQQFNYTPEQLPSLTQTLYDRPQDLQPAEQEAIYALSAAYHDFTDSPEGEAITLDYALSFIHRYVQARNVRPFKTHIGDLPMLNQNEETAVQETATDPNEWMGALAANVAATLINNSGLPKPVQTRLKKDIYHTPADVNSAIKGARAELAELAEDETINIGSSHPRKGITAGDMVEGIDLAKQSIDYFFGVEGATLPPYNYRRFDQLYVKMTGDSMFTGTFKEDEVMFAGASPITLPNMALDAMQKVVRSQFSRLTYYRWYELVTVVEPNDGTLHDPKWIVYGGTGDLPTVSDGAAYAEGQITDSKETDAFEKKGLYVGITRKMIKNSDIAAIRAIPVALAIDSVRTRSAKIASIFTQNSGVGPTLEDGNALFHASGNNVATTALGTDTTAWEAASQECFDHTEVGSGKKIATFAKYNLVPSSLYFQALKNYGYGDGSPTSYNPFAVADRSPDDPRPVVLAVPDWTDANDWAYMANPAVWPTLLMTYSANPGGSSHPEPELFVASNPTIGLMFTNDSMPIKVRDEYAAGVNGRVGIGKRNVA